MEIKDSDIFEDFEEQEDYIDYEWVDKECERQRKEEWDKKHNVHRDKRIKGHYLPVRIAVMNRAYYFGMIAVCL